MGGWVGGEAQMFALLVLTAGDLNVIASATKYTPPVHHELHKTSVPSPDLLRHEHLLPDGSIAFHHAVNNAAAAAPYRATMYNNAIDGKPFLKPPRRGYEDPCNLTGKC